MANRAPAAHHWTLAATRSGDHDVDGPAPFGQLPGASGLHTVPGRTLNGQRPGSDRALANHHGAWTSGGAVVEVCTNGHGARRENAGHSTALLVELA